MKRHLETRWTIFLVAVFIASVVLLTGFGFDESLDIQMHDTYYVIRNTHLLIHTGSLLIAAYFLTLGLKRLALVNGAMKVLSTLITGMAALAFIALTVLASAALLTTSLSGQYISSYGMIILALGLGILLVLRSIEIWKMN